MSFKKQVFLKVAHSIRNNDKYISNNLIKQEKDSSFKALAVLANRMDFEKKHTIANKIDKILRFAADVSELIKINIRELSKTESKPEGMSDRDFYTSLQDKARRGPVFSEYIINKVLSLPEHLMPNSPKPYIKLLANDFKLDPSKEASFSMWAEEVKDYINAVGWKNFNSLNELIRAAMDWHDEFSADESISIQGDPVVYSFKDGFSVVQVKPENLEAEGEAMGHCVGNYCDIVYEGSTQIYSLRDLQGKPHATIEVSDLEVRQIKGKENNIPVDKYKKYIKEWLQKTQFNYKTSADYMSLLNREETFEILKNGDIEVKRIFASKSMDPVILDYLSKDKSSIIREVLAKNKHLPAEAALRLAKDNNDEVKIALINKTTGFPVLEILSKDESRYIRNNIITELEYRINTDKLTLSKEEVVQIINNVLNKGTISILALISIAKNPYSSEDILLRVYEQVSSNRDARETFIDNVNTPPEILQKIYHNFGHITALSHPNFPESIIRNEISKDNADINKIKNILQNESLSSDTLEDLYNKLNDEDKSDITIMMFLSYNKNTPPSILKDLIRNKKVWFYIANNPNLTKEMFELLLNEGDSNIKQQLIHNPSIPKFAIKRLLNDKDPTVKMIAEMKYASYNEFLSTKSYLYKLRYLK